MVRKLSIVSVGIILLTSIACRRQGCIATLPSPTAPAPSEEITAALPVIPDAKFNLADYGAVGDGKALNTDAFKNAVAAIAKAGGGHLIVPAGIYKTLPFTLTSHMDLHLEDGATIKAPETFAEYGIPDPNVPASNPAPGSPQAVAPLISCPPNTTDLAITGSGTIDGSGAIFWIWSDKAARRYPPGRPVVPRPVLVSLREVQRLHVDGITLTNSPMFHLVPRGQDITFTGCKFQSALGFMVQDAKDITFNNVTIANSSGEALVLDNASVKWNGTVKSGTIGGPAERFYR